jgi:hypothetical protein
LKYNGEGFAGLGGLWCRRCGVGGWFGRFERVIGTVGISTFVFVFSGAVPDHPDTGFPLPTRAIGYEVVSDSFDALDTLFAVIPRLRVVG